MSQSAPQSVFVEGARITQSGITCQALPRSSQPTYTNFHSPLCFSRMRVSRLRPGISMSGSPVSRLYWSKVARDCQELALRQLWWMRRLSRHKNPNTKQPKSSSAIHSAFNGFQAINLSFSNAITIGKLKRIANDWEFTKQSFGKVF